MTDRRRFTPRWPAGTWARRALWIVPLTVAVGICAPRAWAAARGVYARLAVLNTIIHLARDVYVDSVDTDKLMDGAIDGLLDRLDPHSSYLPPEEAQRLGERLRGSFGGVGIQYSIIDGVPTVISTIEGSPAANAGLATGDQITAVDNQTTMGWRESEVQEHLRGPSGTSVTVTVDRGGEKPATITIVRGAIPLKSVPYAFMLDDSTGYLRISNFAQPTGREVDDALRELLAGGVRYLILDLRDNGGGDLDAAVQVCDFFLRPGTTIVSQRGRWEGATQTYKATANSRKVDVPVIVLINHGSASASEIVAGALQDTDRGIIVGQRSFGKGLVQRTFDLSRQVADGGMLLLTVARYYTPTGRLIQRDYKAGTAQYLLEGFSDQSPADTARGPAYATPLGRVVYGGGGIRPDRIVPRTRANLTVIRLTGRAAFFRFADELVRQGREFPPTLAAFRSEFTVDAATWEAFVAFVRRVDPELSEDELQGARAEVVPFVIAGIAGRLWGPEAQYRLLAPVDPELAAARSDLVDAARLLAAAALRR